MKRFQFVWWGWWKAFESPGFFAFQKHEHSMSLTYKWSAWIGPLEIRRWTDLAAGFDMPDDRGRALELWSRPACTLRIVQERWYHRFLDKLTKRTDRGHLLARVTFDVYAGPGGISADSAVVTTGQIAESQINRHAGI